MDGTVHATLSPTILLLLMFSNNSNSNYNNSSYNNNNNINNNNIVGDNVACTVPSMQTSANVSSSSADQPFEYVTLTGNVIRSVQPPGKGVGASYRVSNFPFLSPFPTSHSPLSSKLAAKLHVCCSLFIVELRVAVNLTVNG